MPSRSVRLTYIRPRHPLHTKIGCRFVPIPESFVRPGQGIPNHLPNSCATAAPRLQFDCMNRDFFDPPWDETNVVLVDAETIAKAQATGGLASDLSFVVI